MLKNKDSEALPLIPFNKLNPLPETPNNMKEALSDFNKFKIYWLEAINKEFREMIDRRVFVLPTAEESKNAVGFKSKIAFRVNTQVLQNIGKNFVEKLEQFLKFKARLVACGYSQIFGLHYTKNNSPTVSFKSFLIIMHIATVLNWKRMHIDVGNAFLEALLKEDLYMYLPLDWTQGKKILVKLARNIYGLKQAGLLWYLLLKKCYLILDSNCQFGIHVFSSKMLIPIK
jgi:hypothetical protein